MSTVCWGAVKVLTFLNFRLSQDSVATYCRWGGNLCDVHIANFLTNHLVKEFWESVHICQSYYQTSNRVLFWNTIYLIKMAISQIWYKTETYIHMLYWITNRIVCAVSNLPMILSDIDSVSTMASKFAGFKSSWLKYVGNAAKQGVQNMYDWCQRPQAPNWVG